MLTELQTALCTMNISMEAPRNGQAGFKFKKSSDFLAHPILVLSKVAQ
jgi:hypothetical protein